MKQKWIKKEDHVLVLSGNDRGKVGVVLDKKGERILVQGVNVRKLHRRARREGERSDILSVERAIHLSNVALCTMEGEKIKLKVKREVDGSKHLVYLADGKETIYRTLKKSS